MLAIKDIYDIHFKRITSERLQKKIGCIIEGYRKIYLDNVMPYYELLFYISIS
jgi:hypothetical protein